MNSTINASQNEPTDTQQQNTLSLSSSKELLQHESSSVLLFRALSASEPSEELHSVAESEVRAGELCSRSHQENSNKVIINRIRNPIVHR